MPGDRLKLLADGHFLIKLAIDAVSQLLGNGLAHLFAAKGAGHRPADSAVMGVGGASELGRPLRFLAPRRNEWNWLS